MCTVKKELESECDYEALNRYSTDRLLNQIYNRHEKKDHSEPLSASASTCDNVMFLAIHDELTRLRTQINNLQQTVERLPERIFEQLLKNKQIQQSSSLEQYNSAVQQSQIGQTNVTKMDHDHRDSNDDDNDDDDGFDKLSSTSILSDIEILNESIEDNNRELMAWCQRLQINDITNHITVEPKAKVEPKLEESPCESHIYNHWEKRYSSLSQHIKPVVPAHQYDVGTVPKLIPNYSSEIDKNIWLK